MKITALTAAAVFASIVCAQGQVEFLFNLLNGAACAIDCYLDSCDNIDVQCFCQENPTLQSCFQSSCDASILVLLTKGFHTLCRKIHFQNSANL